MSDRTTDNAGSGISAHTEDAETPVKSVWGMVEEIKADLENLSPAQVAAELEAGTAVVVDIRDIRELILKGKIPGAFHAPRGNLEFWIDPRSSYYRDIFRPDGRYILYCAGGGRSAFAARTMKEMGISDVAHLEPGFGGWVEAGLPVEEVASKSKWGLKPT